MLVIKTRADLLFCLRVPWLTYEFFVWETSICVPKNHESIWILWGIDLKQSIWSCFDKLCIWVSVVLRLICVDFPRPVSMVCFPWFVSIRISRQKCVQIVICYFILKLAIRNLRSFLNSNHSGFQINSWVLSTQFGELKPSYVWAESSEKAFEAS